jgi:hypothetical protein
MNRVKYAYATPQPLSAHASGIRARVPLREKIRDRSWLKMSLEAIGLFLFGFGSTALLLHVAAGFFLVSGGASFLPQLSM